MRISIRNKLTFSYLLISFFTALLIYLLTHYTSVQRINALALQYQTSEMIKEAQYWYGAQHSWDGFAEHFKSMHPPQPIQSGKHSGKVKHHLIIDKDRRALLRYLNYQEGDIVPAAYLADATAILYGQQTIGWIIPPDAVGISLDSQMKVFFDNVDEIMIIAVSIAVICSLIMGMVLARVTLKPVELITKASVDIAAGKLAQLVVNDSNDEIGDLTQAFNRMSSDLVKADRQRRQLTADITHDLATPVQVISGYIEMAEEGIELDAERLGMISDELEQINRLLKDMSLLAETDAKTLTLQLAPVDIKNMLEQVYRRYQKSCNDQQIRLQLHCDQIIAEPRLDEERIIQVLGNLITNAIRYTPAKGKIIISACQLDSKLQISVADNGSGISAEDLPYIFDRFYRSCESRSGASGKMGLGLAISRGLVEMHGGEINAYSDKDGAKFIMTLPLC